KAGGRLLPGGNRLHPARLPDHGTARGQTLKPAGDLWGRLQPRKGGSRTIKASRLKPLLQKPVPRGTGGSGFSREGVGVWWSTNFGHSDRLLCLASLVVVGRAVAKRRMQARAVVEADDVIADIFHGLGMVGIVALPYPL